MKVEYNTFMTVEDIFRPFTHNIDLSQVSSAKCIALMNLGGYDSRSVYEIYINKKPRFFSISALDFYEDIESESAYISEWTNATAVKLLDIRTSEQSLYLFEVYSPFGITFSNLSRERFNFPN